jgi:hypothetical protein
MKSALAIVALSLSCVLSLAQAPKSKSKTFSFMPSQTINAPNRTFRKVEIRSDYPLQILVGPCHNDYTVEFFCNSEPADIFIRDVRHYPVFLTPKANSVTITLTEF